MFYFFLGKKKILQYFWFLKFPTFLVYVIQYLKFTLYLLRTNKQKNRNLFKFLSSSARRITQLEVDILFSVLFSNFFNINEVKAFFETFLLIHQFVSRLLGNAL